jgi:hypothetical protein
MYWPIKIFHHSPWSDSNLLTKTKLLIKSRLKGLASTTDLRCKMSNEDPKVST